MNVDDFDKIAGGPFGGGGGEFVVAKDVVDEFFFAAPGVQRLRIFETAERIDVEMNFVQFAKEQKIVSNFHVKNAGGGEGWVRRLGGIDMKSFSCLQ